MSAFVFNRIEVLNLCFRRQSAITARASRLYLGQKNDNATLYPHGYIPALAGGAGPDWDVFAGLLYGRPAFFAQQAQADRLAQMGRHNAAGAGSDPCDLAADASCARAAIGHGA